MGKESLRVFVLSVLTFLLLAPVARAQEPTAGAAPGLTREEPTDVAGLVEKVIRGVVTVDAALVTSEFPSAAGSGSGFVIDKEGHVITNAHVSGRSSINRVVLWDGTSYRADLVAAAPGLDIALIKIHNPDPDKMFPVTLGDSSKVQPGELALAMGSPGAMEGYNIDRSDPFEYSGLRSTATMRVVIGRETNIDFQVNWWHRGRYEMGLQYATKLPYAFKMCAGINPGNSGGPLFNRRGEVIGINTWGAGMPLSDPLNLSVPINSAKQFVAEVLEKQQWDVPWMGMYVVFPPNVQTPWGYVEFRERFREPGVHVYGVVLDSPAGKAGLMDGDEIVEVNDRVYELPEKLRVDVLESAIGQEYHLRVKRGSKMLTFKLRTVPKPRWVYDFSV